MNKGFSDILNLYSFNTNSILKFIVDFKIKDD